MASSDSGGYISLELAELYDPVYGSVGREDRQFFIDEAVAAGGAQVGPWIVGNLPSLPQRGCMG